MSTLVPHAQLGAVEAEARERVEAVEIERRALQQELLERTAEAMALDEENATLRKIAVSASTGSIKVSGVARVCRSLSLACVSAASVAILSLNPPLLPFFSKFVAQLKNANFDCGGIMQEISRTERIGEAVDTVREENIFLHRQLDEEVNGIDAMSMSELRADMIQHAATMRATASGVVAGGNSSNFSPAAFRDTSTRFNQAEGTASAARTPTTATTTRPASSASELSM